MAMTLMRIDWRALGPLQLLYLASMQMTLWSCQTMDVMMAEGTKGTSRAHIFSGLRNGASC